MKLTSRLKLAAVFLILGNKMSIGDVILCVDLLPLLDKEWAPTDGYNVYLRDILTKDYKFIREWFRLVTTSKAFSSALLQFKINLTTNTTVIKKPRKKSTTSQSEVTSKGDGVDGNAATKGTLKSFPLLFAIKVPPFRGILQKDDQFNSTYIGKKSDEYQS